MAARGRVDFSTVPAVAVLRCRPGTAGVEVGFRVGRFKIAGRVQAARPGRYRVRCHAGWLRVALDPQEREKKFAATTIGSGKGAA